MIKTRNYSIDNLRAIAAIFVVFHHFEGIIPIIYQSNFYNEFIKYGYLGVEVFFVLSGYCIILAFDKYSSVKEYLVKRFFRIYPIYWFSLGFAMFMVIFYTITQGVNSVAILPKTFIDIFLTFICMTSPATKIPTINWVYWTLTYEIIFYLVIAITAIYKKYMNYFLIIVTAFCTFSNLNHYYLLFWTDKWYLFAFGIAVYLFHKKDIKSALAIFIIAFMYIFNIKKEAEYLDFIVGISTVILLFFQFKIINFNNFLTRIGESSYSLYLIHVPLGCYFFGLFKSKFILESLPLTIFYDIIVCAICIFISHFSYLYIEKYFINIGNRLFPKK